ncbi:MAG: hypothetical protein JO155_11800 [Acidimicrobiia bacterium]|nr:hypothetical protein [Acidimicrobiia bacterium]
MADVELPARVEIYDTTLRDGAQLEGISLTVDDKLRIAEQLDWLGVDYVEAGWPGANPKDDEVFRRANRELTLGTATLVERRLQRLGDVEVPRLADDAQRARPGLDEAPQRRVVVDLAGLASRGSESDERAGVELELGVHALE